MSFGSRPDFALEQYDLGARVANHVHLLIAVCGQCSTHRRTGGVRKRYGFLSANPNRLLLDGRSHGAIVTGARLEEDLESFLYTS